MRGTKTRTAATIRRETLERAQSEGLETAYETALGLCRDSNAPAQAKAAAISALLRLGGGFEKHENLDEMDPEEMSPEQFQRAVANAKAFFAAKMVEEETALDEAENGEVEAGEDDGADDEGGAFG